MSKQSARLNRALRARGVYRPYATIASDGTVMVESYPLTVYLANGLDPEEGPYHRLRLTDSSLPRIGQDSVVTTCKCYLGQDVETHIARLLIDYHQPAYDRATEQDNAAYRKAAEFSAKGV